MNRPALRVACVLLAAMALVVPRAGATQDEAAEASRARDEQSSVGTEDEAPRAPAGAQPAVLLSPRLRLGAFAGLQAPALAAGAMLEALAGVDAEWSRYHAGFDVDFERDPFALNTFELNEQAGGGTTAELIERTHAVRTRVLMSADWSDTLRSSFAARWRETWSDRRTMRHRDVTFEADTRLGAMGFAAGPSLTLALFGTVERYPNYLVSERRLDQRSGGGSVGAGYSFGRIAELGAVYTLDAIDYLNARYDAVDANGDVVRASESRNYLAHELDLRIRVRPTRATRITLDYGLRRNNSIHYTRAVTAMASNGSDETRVIRDYFDFTRHSAALGLRLRPPGRVECAATLEVWRRNFDTYQARSSDNVWLDETRMDEGVELDIEIGVRLLESDAGDLTLLAIGSHSGRRSNMRRETSFATTFAFARAFIGLEYEL